MIAAKLLGPCLRAVHNAYQKRPVLSDCIVGFSCFTLGEWAAQWYSGRYEHEGEAINYDMVLKTGLLGIVVNGLLLRKWYLFLDRVFSPSMTDYRVIAKKILADQLVMPPAYLAIFFTYTTAVDKTTSWEEKKKELRLKFQNCFIPAYVTDCLIWPFANITTFRYVPLSYRPAYIGVAELLWQTYLSHIQVAPKHDAHTPTSTPSKSGNNDRVPVQEAQSTTA